MNDNDMIDTIASVATAYSDYAEARYLKEVDDVSDIEITAGYDRLINQFKDALARTDEKSEFKGSPMFDSLDEALSNIIKVAAYENGYISGAIYPRSNVNDNIVAAMNACEEGDRVTSVGIAAGYLAASEMMLQSERAKISTLEATIFKMKMEQLINGDEGPSLDDMLGLFGLDDLDLE